MNAEHQISVGEVHSVGIPLAVISVIVSRVMKKYHYLLIVDVEI